MKTAFLIASLIVSTSFAQQKMVESDLSQIYGTGSSSYSAPFTKIKLKPGVYALGDDNNKMTGTHYLIVDDYVNNQEKGLALLIDQSELRDKSQARGRLYMIRPIQGGSTLMLSPIEIGMNGQLGIHSELDGTGNSPVLTVSLDPQAQKLNYPYIIRGHNGALGGQLLGMRAKSDQNPTFRPWPSHAVFNSETDSGKLLVQNNVVSIHDPRRLDREFQLVPLNGVLGKMAALVSTKLNTMEESYVSNSAIKELAFFMNLDDCELFMIARPTLTQPGEFLFSFYGPRHRTFMDFFRKGKWSP